MLDGFLSYPDSNVYHSSYNVLRPLSSLQCVIRCSRTQVGTPRCGVSVALWRVALPPAQRAWSKVASAIVPPALRAVTAVAAPLAKSAAPTLFADVLVLFEPI